jgi:hypothetical protein
VAVEDRLPAGLSLSSWSADRGTYDEGTGIWSVGTVAVGAVLDLEMVATSDSPGSKTNTAEVIAADQFDVDSTPGNHNAAEDDQDSVSLTPKASIAGFVYVDANNDGIRQADEQGIRDVTITLSGTDELGNSVRRTTQTDADGRYFFGDLRPSGESGYQIAEDQPARYRDGKDTPGTPLSLMLFDQKAVDDIFTGIGLAAGVEGKDFNFGELAATFSKRRFLASSR